MDKYKISEIAEIYNISKQMVRYYEECGVLEPSRSDNNYRYYTSPDMFWLGEIIQLQYLGVNIKHSKEVMNEQFIDQKVKRYRESAEQLGKEINYNQILKLRCESVATEMEWVSLNEGNYYIKRIPGFDWFPLQKAQLDTYEKMTQNLSFSQSFTASKDILFGDPVCFFHDTYEYWGVCIEDKYVKAVNITYDSKEKIESTKCLCTVINMGRIGEFSRSFMKDLYAYADLHNLKPTGIPHGMIRGGFGKTSNGLSRYLEIRLPIE